MNSHKLRNNQSGAVAMITVILLSFIFLVVTLGFLRLAINEQRTATDTDLNSRAYYAAESGIEDGKRVINSLYSDGVISESDEDRLNGDTCEMASTTGSPDPILSEELDTEITCQIIDFSPGDYLATLQMNESVFIPLIPDGDGVTPDDVDKVVIEWHELEKDDSNAVPRSTSQTDIPSLACWRRGSSGSDSCSATDPAYPAMLRAALFTHDQGAFTRSDIETRLSYLNPTDDSTAGSVTLNSFETKDSGLNTLSQRPNCTNIGSTYLCKLEVTGLKEVNYLRLTAIYSKTNIRVTIFDGGTQLNFSNAQASLDVTGKAGDVVRRIEARLPLNPIDILPDDAITTSDQLCKLLTINGTASAKDDCPD